MSENEDFGLRDVEYEPIERGEQAKKASTFQEKKKDEEAKSKLPIIFGILVVILMAFGAYYFFSMRPEQELKAKKLAQDSALKAQEDFEAMQLQKKADILDEEKLAAEAKQAEEEAAASAIPEVGTITVLSAKTGRSYVVVGSFFDRDQAMDYGNKVAKEGINSFILEPVGKVKFYRLGVADFDTYTEASNNLNTFQGEYGDQIWVLKY